MALLDFLTKARQLPMMSARGAALGGGLGAVTGQAGESGALGGLSELLGAPRHYAIEPILEMLGLPKTGMDLARVISGLPSMDPGAIPQPPDRAYYNETSYGGGQAPGWLGGGQPDVATTHPGEMGPYPGEQPRGMGTPPGDPGMLARLLGLVYDAATDPLSYSGMIGGALAPGLMKTGRMLNWAEEAAPAAKALAAAEPSGLSVAKEAYEAGQLGGVVPGGAARTLTPRAGMSSTLAQALGTTERPNQLMDVLLQNQAGLTGDVARDISLGPTSQYSQDYLAHIPELADVLKNPQGMLYRRTSPAASQLIEGAGLGMKTPEGLQTVPGFGAKESLIGGRGGVMFPREPGLPNDIYASHALGQQMTPMELLEKLRQLAALQQ